MFKKSFTDILTDTKKKVSSIKLPSPLSEHSTPLSEHSTPLSEHSPRYSFQFTRDVTKNGSYVLFILNDPIYGKNFREYSIEKKCSENIEFLDDILNFEENLDLKIIVIIY